ncbi:EpsG family protein [Shewanella algae]|uniref:EpsG family protein n=1 Tax=Shewanella algae TaxID=38313 RepID=UPI003AAEC510
MQVYLFLFLVVMLLAFLLSSLSRKLTSRSIHFLYMFFSFPLLGSLAAFRYDVGVDYKEYEYVFNLVRFSEHKAEPFINLIVYFFSFFTNSNVPVFALLAFITVYLFLDFILKNTHSIFVSFCIFLCFGGFYLGMFNHVRQFLAVSIFLYSFKYIRNGSFFSYLVCILIASSVHYSAVLMVPMYFILKLRLNFRNVLFLIVCYFIAIGFSEFFIRMTPYAIYLERVVDNERNLYLTVGFVFLSFLYVFLGLRDKISDTDSIFFYMALISGLLLSSTFVSSLPWNLFFRLNGYFIPYLIIFFGYLYYRLLRFDVLLSLMYKVLFFVGCYAYLYYSLAVKGSDYNLVPYRTIFEGGF